MRRWRGASWPPPLRAPARWWWGRRPHPASPIELGVPWGARLAGQRPGIRISSSATVAGISATAGRVSSPGTPARRDRIRLHQDDGELFLDLPEAVVPQRPQDLVGLILVPNGPRASHGDGHEITMANVTRPDPTGTSDGHRGQLSRSPHRKGPHMLT